MIYVDTAAIVKLIRRERETDALYEWLGSRQAELVSSALAEVELPRALRRTEPQLLAAVPGVLGRIALYEVDDVVRATAAAYPDEHLRSLDAIHLATAHAAIGGALTCFVTYDKRLAAAAEAVGLPVSQPGT